MYEQNLRRINCRPQVRIVPGFTIQTAQKNTKSDNPPPANYRKVRPPPRTNFRRAYDVGSLPVALEHGWTARGLSIRWLVDIHKLSIPFYLPLFCNGLCEIRNPLQFLSSQGTLALVEVAGREVLPILKECIDGIRLAFYTKHPASITNACYVIQKMALCCHDVAEAIVKRFYRTLSLLSSFRSCKPKFRGEMDYCNTRNVLGDIIEDTLHILDERSGPSGYYYLKLAIPSFESKFRNR